MRRHFLATLLLAGCSHYSNPAEIEGTIVTPGNFIAGSGVITNVAVVPRANNTPGAQDPNHYRISLRMDNGGVQNVDTDNSTFMVGQAVDLTNDGRIVHVSGTTLNR
jgi:hypothetical protein